METKSVPTSLTKLTFGEYVKHMSKVYPSKGVVVKSSEGYINSIIQLVMRDPVGMSSVEFIKKYMECIKLGKLSYDLQAIDRFFAKKISRMDSVDEDVEEYASDLRGRLVSWYNEDRASFISQFYKNNQNTRGMVDGFKNWVTGLSFYRDYDEFSFRPISITTHIKDSQLNDLIERKYGVSISNRGFDAIAVSKTGHVFCIEAKYVGEYGSHQINQMSVAINLAKQSNGIISGLAIIDGEPALDTSRCRVIKENYNQVMGRIISSDALLGFLERN